MVTLMPEQLLRLIAPVCALTFCKFSPASKSTKAWVRLYLSISTCYIISPETFRAASVSIRHFFVTEPTKAALTVAAIAVPLKYIQRKLRFARINAIKWKYGYTEDPASWENMTIEQAQEIESNMAETSTDPGVSRAISSSGHFINEDKRVEHQRMQATIHLMTGFAAYKVKSRNHSLVVARINEHHQCPGSTDLGIAPSSHSKFEPSEVHAIWVLWRELACRMGVKSVPKDLKQAMEWRKNFENTFRWREDANELMATAMLDQVLYPVPSFLKGFVACVFASIVDWNIVYYCQLEKLHPSPWVREIVFDIFRMCGWLIREFGLPRLGRYQRSPDGPNKKGKMNFGHTPYDTMPWWQERSFWNLWGPRALLGRLRGLPLPSEEFESGGVTFEAMGAPHSHPATQSKIEKKVLENAAILEQAPYGYRPSVGFQAARLLPPFDGPIYGSEMNTFPEGTRTTLNSPARFTREYERRGETTSLVFEESPKTHLGDTKQEHALNTPPMTPPAAPIVSATA